MKGNDYQNKPLGVEEPWYVRTLKKHQRTLIVFACLAGGVFYLVARTSNFIEEFMGHLDISEQGVSLTNPIRDQKVLESWMDEHFTSFPKTDKPRIFGYEISVMGLRGNILVFGKDNQIVETKCLRFNLMTLAFDCLDPELVAYVQFNDGADIQLPEGDDIGSITLNGANWPYSRREIPSQSQTASVAQLVVKKDNRTYIIMQGPSEKINPPALMDFFY